MSTSSETHSVSTCKRMRGLHTYNTRMTRSIMILSIIAHVHPLRQLSMLLLLVALVLESCEISGIVDVNTASVAIFGSITLDRKVY